MTRDEDLLRIVSLNLVDASQNPAVNLGVLTDNQVISLHELGSTELSIEAVTGPAPGVVVVEFVEVSVGNDAVAATYKATSSPYALRGANRQGRFYPSPVLSAVGTYVVTATISRDGVKGNTISLTLTISP